MAAMNRAMTNFTAFNLTEVVSLESSGLYCLPYVTLSLRVISGTAWITSQAEDYILEANDQMMIPRQAHAVLVSAVGHQPLCFEFCRL